MCTVSDSTSSMANSVMADSMMTSAMAAGVSHVAPESQKTPVDENADLYEETAASNGTFSYLSRVPTLCDPQQLLSLITEQDALDVLRAQCKIDRPGYVAPEAPFHGPSHAKPLFPALSFKKVKVLRISSDSSKDKISEEIAKFLADQGIAVTQEKPEAKAPTAPAAPLAPAAPTDLAAGNDDDIYAS